MPIEILAGMVVVGLAFAIAAVRFSGLSRPASLDNQARAREILAGEYADESVRDCRIAADRDSAFLLLGSGNIGVVLAFGSKFVVRLVAAAPGSAEVEGSTLKMKPRDFTFPKSSYVLATATDASTVAGWLNGNLE
jgi:hypothetical protein